MGMVRCFPRYDQVSLASQIDWILVDADSWHGTDNMDASRIAEADGTVNALGKEYLSL
jgi:hypothetical protein